MGDGFHSRALATKGAVNCGVYALFECAVTSFLALPDVDVIQGAVVATHTEMQEPAGKRVWAYLLDDSAIELLADRDVLRVGVDHGVLLEFDPKDIRMNPCKVAAVSEPVKSRRGYDTTKRAEQAAATRRAILDSARQLFVHHGYAKTTVEQIAVEAGVAVDTIYASVGRKPALLRELVETAISGRDHPIPARQREYVLQMKAAVDAKASIEIYAAAITEIQQRMAPVFRALRDAAVSDDSCAALWHDISERRARNMRDFAADLRSTGQLRLDLSDEQVADIIWSMNAAEYWDLLVIQ